jgi:hypothetical protein
VVSARACSCRLWRIHSVSASYWPRRTGPDHSVDIEAIIIVGIDSTTASFCSVASANVPEARHRQMRSRWTAVNALITQWYDPMV